MTDQYSVDIYEQGNGENFFICSYKSLPIIPREGEKLNLYLTGDAPAMFKVVEVVHDMNPDARLCGVILYVVPDESET